MLKITKGLRPFVESGITLYADDKGDEYVRVKMDGEDFCIALHDYARKSHDHEIKQLTWDEAMKGVTNMGLTLFTKEQAVVYKKHQEEIDKKLIEIGGDALEDDWYWTSEEREDDKDFAYVYVNTGQKEGRLAGVSTIGPSKGSSHRARPVLDLSH